MSGEGLSYEPPTNSPEHLISETSNTGVRVEISSHPSEAGKDDIYWQATLLITKLHSSNLPQVENSGPTKIPHGRGVFLLYGIT